MTLSDRSEDMLAASWDLNPECEHVIGDMRTLRLGRAFDAVFVLDAIQVLTTEADLAAAIATAFEHCRPGGISLFVPDYTRELFRASTGHGGHDGPDGRAVRYLEWVWDPDPADTTCVAEVAVVIREPGGGVRHVSDRHVEGVFPERVWLGLLAEAGFRARALVEPDEDGIDRPRFVAVRPA